MSKVPVENTAEEMALFFERAMPRRLRSLLQFAQDEIILPDGPYKGRRFRPSVQPWASLFLRELDNARWRRRFMTGNVQCGKTLIGFGAGTMYHLFELRENVVLGLPTMDMANDKWAMDLRPMIEASRYRDLLPIKGEGSRDGKVRSMVEFRNGAVLKFMSAGGGDEKRSGFTSRVAALTEIDKMDSAGEASREADPVTQFERRLDSHGVNSIVFGECTVSIPEGRIWQEVTVTGSNSRIALHCPHCRGWVTPERDSLVGWQDAKTETEAEEKSRYSCPKCGALWTEDDRRWANERSVLLHGEMKAEDGEVLFAGQSIVEDEAGEVLTATAGTLKGWRIDGGEPPTRTLGFRTTAVNNMFWTAGLVGVREWKAKRAKDQQNAEKELSQFVWTIPYKPPVEEETELKSSVIAKRQWGPGRGILPANTVKVTMGVDIRKREIHWTLLAELSDGSLHVADYGVEVVHWEMQHGPAAMLAALELLHDRAEAGWPVEGQTQKLTPSQRWIDSSWLTDTVYTFVRKHRNWKAVKGFSASEYTDPKKTTKETRFIGKDFHGSFIKADNIVLHEINVDAWKSEVHRSLEAPFLTGDKKRVAGSLTLFTGGPYEHSVYSKHLTAEKELVENDPRRGLVRKWIHESGQNHWFDTLTYAMAARERCPVGGLMLAQPQVAVGGGVGVEAVGQQANRPAGVGSSWRSGGRAGW